MQHPFIKHKQSCYDVTLRDFGGLRELAFATGVHFKCAFLTLTVILLLLSIAFLRELA